MKHAGRTDIDKKGATVSFAVHFTAEELGIILNKDPNIVGVKEIQESFDKGAYDFSLAFLRILMFEVDISFGKTPNQIKHGITSKEGKKKRKKKKRIREGIQDQDSLF